MLGVGPTWGNTSGVAPLARSPGFGGGGGGGGKENPIAITESLVIAAVGIALVGFTGLGQGFGCLGAWLLWGVKPGHVLYALFKRLRFKVFFCLVLLFSLLSYPSLQDCFGD